MSGFNPVVSFGGNLTNLYQPLSGGNGSALHFEYEGLSVDFSSDAWFNATPVAARYEKEPAQWLRLPSTVSYIGALRRKYGDFTYLKARRGLGGGTWMHPKLAVRFAQWLDVDFSVWCDEQVDRILRNKHAIAKLPEPSSKRSTVADREPLFVLAGRCVARHRLRFTRVYKEMSLFAGCDRFRAMTCAQVCDAAKFAERLLDCAVTDGDWQRLSTNGVLLGRESTQLLLFGEVA